MSKRGRMLCRKVVPFHRFILTCQYDLTHVLTCLFYNFLTWIFRIFPDIDLSLIPVQASPSILQPRSNLLRNRTLVDAVCLRHPLIMCLFQDLRAFHGF